MKLITSEMLGVELRHNYYIDEHGNIFSEYSNKFLTHERTKNGYLRVEIQGKHYLVHRLVAMAFLGIKSNGYEVNHKDQNPENNDIDNLEWVTHKENINYESLYDVVYEFITDYLFDKPFELDKYETIDYNFEIEENNKLIFL